MNTKLLAQSLVVFYCIIFFSSAKAKTISDPVISITNSETTIEVLPIPLHNVFTSKITVNFTCSKATKSDMPITLVITGGNAVLNALFVPAAAAPSANTIAINIPKGKTSFAAHLVISYNATDLTIPVHAYISQSGKPENSLDLTFTAKKDLPVLKSKNDIKLKIEEHDINAVQNAAATYLTEKVTLTFSSSEKLPRDTSIVLYIVNDGGSINALFVSQPPATKTLNTYTVKLSPNESKSYTADILLNYQLPGHAITDPVTAYISIKDRPEETVSIKITSKVVTPVAAAPVKPGKPAVAQTDISLVSDAHTFTLAKNTGSDDATATEAIELKFKCSAVLPADQEVTLYIEGSAEHSSPLFITGLQSATTGNTIKIKIPKGYIAYTTSVLVKYHMPTTTLANAVAHISIKDKPGDVLILKFTNKAEAATPAIAATTPATPAATATTTTTTTTPAAASTTPTVTLMKNSHELSVMKTLNGDPSFTDTVSLFFKAKTKIVDGSPVSVNLVVQGDANGISPMFFTSSTGIATSATLAAKIDVKMYVGDDKTDSLPIYKLPVRYAYKTLKNGLTDPAVAFVFVKEDPGNITTLKFTNAVEVTKSNPYWMEVGANFDLIDGLSANNLFASVMAFEKDKYKLNFFNLFKTPVSFIGGVYESQSTGQSMSSDSGLVYRDARSYVQDATTKKFPYFRDAGSFNATTSIKSVGLFFSPHFKFAGDDTEKDGLHLYFSMYAEMLWQRVKTVYNYDNLNNVATYYADTAHIYNQVFKESQNSMDFRSHYFGLGLPLYISSGDYNIYINPVIGRTNQRFTLVQTPDKNDIDRQKSLYESYILSTPNNTPNNDPLNNLNPSSTLNNAYYSGYLTPKNTWNWFYVLQFRLTSEKYGIAFTGEVRGLTLRQNKPIVSLALSKKFDPGHLFGTLFGKTN
jgi:hypothetical protein